MNAKMTTNASVNTPVSGIGAGDTINKCQIVWILQGTDDVGRTDLTIQANLNASAAAAISAGRTSTWNQGASDAAIAAMQTTAGYTFDIGTLVDGATYVPAVQWTENMSGGGTQTGAWTKGAAVTYGTSTTTTTTTTSTTTTTAAPGDADFSLYTNTNSTFLTVDSTNFKIGSTSMKFVNQSDGAVRLYRSVTMPASGTVTFTRWFMTNAKFAFSGQSEFQIAALADAHPVTAWKGAVGYHHDAGIASVSGIGMISAGAWVQVYAESSMSANVWYKVTTEYNCTNNTYRVTVYAADGTTQLAQSSFLAAPANFANSSCVLLIGQLGQAGYTCWVDGLSDGI